ncbi:hypothetical protein [Streptomyces sp. NPDC002205]|uniref:AraC-like ligand-binding domain-containing protein n=1 Tax=Streptomyces sp. NPDC002205 TaxID=3154411 RepID=UPI003330EC28
MTPGALVRDDGSLLATASVPGHRRWEWREALSRTFGVVDMSVPEEVNSGTIRTAPLGRLHVTTVDGGSLQARRTRGPTAQGDNDGYVVVKLLSRGGARLEQDARRRGRATEEVFVYGVARPVRLILPEPFPTKCLVLPRQILGLSESDLRQITTSPLRCDTALGGPLSAYLSQLAETAGSRRAHTGELITRNVVGLLNVLADERLGRISAGTPSGDAAADPGVHRPTPRRFNLLFLENPRLSMSWWRSSWSRMSKFRQSTSWIQERHGWSYYDRNIDYICARNGSTARVCSLSYSCSQVYSDPFRNARRG